MIMDKVVKDIGELSVDVAATIINCHTGNAGPLVAPIVKYLLKRGLDKVIKDVVSRQLSEMQKAKVNEVRDYAILTFYKLAEENGWEENDSEAFSYSQTIAESIEDIFNKAVNESRRAKRIILGAYLGSSLYHSNSPNPNWENFFYISTIIERLTFRQLCMISLIGNRFDEIKIEREKSSITDKVTISELNDLRSQNFWIPAMSFMGGTPKEIPLDYITPTDTTLELKSAILFPEAIREDYQRVVESMKIQPLTPSNFPNGFLSMLNMTRSINQ